MTGDEALDDAWSHAYELNLRSCRVLKAA